MTHPLIESGRLRDLSWIFPLIDRASSPYELDALFHVIALCTAYPAFHPQLKNLILKLSERYAAFEDRRESWSEFPEREKDRTLLWFIFATLNLVESEAELDSLKDFIRRTVPSEHGEMHNLIKEIKIRRSQLRDTGTNDGG